MQLSILDSDILSQLLKQRNPKVVASSSRYLQEHRQFAFSALTRYEVVRGLKHRNAPAQLARFNAFCEHSVVLPVTDLILERAADLWAFGRHRGHAHRDADLIIAATAIENGRALVTANTSHFAWIPALVIEDWTKP